MNKNMTGWQIWLDAWETLDHKPEEYAHSIICVSKDGIPLGYNHIGVNMISVGIAGYIEHNWQISKYQDVIDDYKEIYDMKKLNIDIHIFKKSQEFGFTLSVSTERDAIIDIGKNPLVVDYYTGRSREKIQRFGLKTKSEANLYSARKHLTRTKFLQSLSCINDPDFECKHMWTYLVNK